MVVSYPVSEKSVSHQLSFPIRDISSAGRIQNDVSLNIFSSPKGSKMFSCITYPKEIQLGIVKTFL